jgi:hypothetical protein
MVELLTNVQAFDRAVSGERVRDGLDLGPGEFNESQEELK